MWTLGVLTAGALLIVYSAVIRGVALTFLWAWFIAAKFNLPDLAIPEAIGLMVIVAFFSGKAEKPKVDETAEHTLWRCFSRATGHTLGVLGIGYVAHLFV